MKRLTKLDGNGNWYIEGVGLGECNVKLYDALCKLKNYEDTGLSPEEINDLNTFDGSQAIMATARLQREQRKHRWIPVSERLPEDGENVLASERDGEVQIAYRDYCGWHLSFNGFLYRISPNAWMPLPEPYEPD
ncbi:MAG: DUF551 domain-containing protein [Lachnospiraceae bacterium]